MLMVDTHCHVSEGWYEPLELLRFQMERNGVAKAALTQADTEFDNSYLFECVKRYPGQFSPVVIVDHDREDAPQQLKKLAAEGAAGARFRPQHRSPGKDPYAIWKACNELGLPVSLAGREPYFGSDEFRQLLAVTPDIPMIMEHLGHVIPDQAPPYEGFKKVLALAKIPNVYLKVNGLGELCKRPYPFTAPFYAKAGIPPFIKMVYETFGPKRMMWGSNYPPVSGKEGYANALKMPLAHMKEFCSEADLEWIMGKTAESVFKFH
jgi:L-fuconolactonase